MGLCRPYMQGLCLGLEGYVRLSKKSYLVIIGIAVVVLAVIGVQMVLGGKKSSEVIKREIEVKELAINGWAIKHDARLYVNKDKVKEFKQRLMGFYSAEAGALVEQQRLLDALTAADIAAATDDNSGEKITNFSISAVEFKKEKISNEKAELEAEIEFYIKYHTQAQDYSTYGKNTYRWELAKEKDKWKIVKEELVPAAE